jgi:hypothetical protein
MSNSQTEPLDDEEPEVHIPEELRQEEREDGVQFFVQPREVMYAGGYLGPEVDDFGMDFGPIPNLKEVLEWVPDKGSNMQAIIVKFNSDWTDDILYEWSGRMWLKNHKKWDARNKIWVPV